MRFLIDADLPRRIQATIASYGHVATDVRDVGLRHAKDPEVAAYALTNSLCLVSADWGFADIRHFPPEQHAGIVVLGLANDATGDQITELLCALLRQPHLVERLPGHLAIVEYRRIRFRPPL